MSYLLDANVFIQAKNFHYGLDFCPAFWHWLINQNDAGLVYTIDKVSAEISAGCDDLSTWMESLKDSTRTSNAERRIEKLEGFKSETQNKLQAIVPVGFCYLQPQGTLRPNELWPDPDFEWEQVSQTEGLTIWKRKS